MDRETRKSTLNASPTMPDETENQQAINTTECSKQMLL